MAGTVSVVMTAVRSLMMSFSIVNCVAAVLSGMSM